MHRPKTCKQLRSIVESIVYYWFKYSLTICEDNNAFLHFLQCPLYGHFISDNKKANLIVNICRLEQVENFPSLKNFITAYSDSPSIFNGGLLSGAFFM